MPCVIPRRTGNHRLNKSRRAFDLVIENPGKPIPEGQASLIKRCLTVLSGDPSRQRKGVAHRPAIVKSIVKHITEECRWNQTYAPRVLSIRAQTGENDPETQC